MLPNFFSVVTVHIFTIHVSHVFGDFQIIGVRNYKLQQVYHTVLSYIILWSYMWTVYIRLFSFPLQWHKMYSKCPEHPSSSLLTTAAEEKQTSHRLLFVFFFGLFRPWYECICDRFYCRQCCHSHAGIFKWNFDDFLWETVSEMWRNLD